jgi:hypothetical protein
MPARPVSSVPFGMHDSTKQAPQMEGGPTVSHTLLTRVR